jgi:hypothetical protein
MAELAMDFVCAYMDLNRAKEIKNFPNRNYPNMAGFIQSYE